MNRSPDPAALAALPEATKLLLRSVDAMSDEDWPAPSPLPGWTRAHVVAHLALNAEALAGVAQGLTRHQQVPMYASQERRDRDIEELAAAGPSELRSRLLGSSTRLQDLVGSVPAEAWSRRFDRTPGGPSLPAAAVPGMRWREVEVHHVDLGLGRTRADWSTTFGTALVDAMVRRHDAWPGPFRVRATDVDRVWECDPAGQGATAGERPTVSGTVADLGWWLSGRGDGEGLTSDSGELPRIGAM